MNINFIAGFVFLLTCTNISGNNTDKDTNANDDTNANAFAETKQSAANPKINQPETATLKDPPNSQTKLKFGADFAFIDNDVYKLISDTSNYVNFFSKYNIEYLRFPGGSPTRFFIYNNGQLTAEAKTKVFDYYKTVGKKELEDGPDDSQKRVNFQNDYYQKYLNFCFKNEIKPIIQLNTCFYAYNNQLYQVAPFRKEQKKGQGNSTKDNNAQLKAFLTTQIKLAHEKFDKITWEIGNEDYFMYSEETSAHIVKQYTSLIRSLYPKDIIIVPIANAMGDENNTKKGKNNWNTEFIQLLDKENLLNQIDYFAPHFYINTNVAIKNYSELATSLKAIDFVSFEKLHLSFFPKNYRPKFFYTEFAVFLKPDQNPSYNTQIHGLMLFYYLMNYYRSGVLGGVIYHSLLSQASPLFYTKDKSTETNSAEMKSDTASYKYISIVPVQAKAEQIFYRNVGNEFVNYIQNGNMNILITKTGNKMIYFILNFSEQSNVIDKKDLISAIPDDNYTITTYSFADINSKKNSVFTQSKVSSLKNITSLSIDKFSILIIK